MSNKYRTATQTRRGARSGFPEHDDFEGLPVRQWRQEWVNVASAPPAESSQQNDIWDRELFYGMPKDAPLLAPHSQELLRLARSGRLYKRPAPADEDDMDNDGLEAKGNKKESESGVEGFMVKTWKQIPGNADGPTVSHLAKRHKNTVTLPSKAVLAQITGPTASRHKVRRIDAAGNPYEQTVTVAEGQKVDGEIISTTIVPLHNANPEAAAGQTQTTPARRRPPPPKRKAKGPGRGRKKGRLPLAAPAPAGPAPAQQPLAEGGVPPIKTETSGSDVVKMEENEDSEMADNSAMPSEDEDGEDGDEGDEEGDETPEVENVADQDHEMEDAEMPVIRPSSIEEPSEERRRSTSEEEITVPKPARFPAPPGLGSLGPRLSSPRVEGSPLKHVIIQSPTDQSPMVSPQAGSAAASSYMGVHTAMSSVVETAAGGATVSSSSVATSSSQVQTAEPSIPPLPTTTTTAAETTSNILNSLSSEPTTMETATIESPTKEPVPAAATPLIKDEHSTNGTPVPVLPVSVSSVLMDVDMSNPPTSSSTNSEQPTAQAQRAEEQQQPEVAVTSEPRPEPPDSPTLHPTATGADEDEGLNLLGSLERELDMQEDSLSRSASAGGGGNKDSGGAAETASLSQSAGGDPGGAVNNAVGPSFPPVVGAGAAGDEAGATKAD
ncbi:hypothetical protein QBC37DRAFT_378809 [Rhypophila decipiens]|uniref:Uncharacterized protein n=1 Tax=Rhypophila decipiens TaxID=261697 RepID=A0AAN6XXG8_9PEZI|nr:hypothetical protein QBC37DRAFT_378809 [Rhypophila decipiens]